MNFTFPQLIKELNKRHIEIEVNDGKIRYQGPESNITPDILEGIKQYKNKLISHLLNPRVSNLMPIQTEGHHTPLFLIHAQEANYFISEQLGKDYPVYGFFHIGSDGKKVPIKSVDEMVSNYIDLIKMISPKGPYMIGGFSFGGILAFKIAARLKEVGDEVKFLAIVDAIGDKNLCKKKFRKHDTIRSTIKQNIYYPFFKFFSNNLRLLLAIFLYRLKKPIPLLYRPFIIVNHYKKLYIKTYYPEKYDGDIVLIKTEATKHPLEDLGWASLANHVSIYSTKGEHSSIFGNKKIGEIFAKEISKITKHK